MRKISCCTVKPNHPIYKRYVLNDSRKPNQASSSSAENIWSNDFVAALFCQQCDVHWEARDTFDRKTQTTKVLMNIFTLCCLTWRRLSPFMPYMACISSINPFFLMITRIFFFNLITIIIKSEIGFVNVPLVRHICISESGQHWFK